MEVKHCTEEGIHVFCPGEGCFGFIPREEIIWGIVDSACSLYDEGERLWVCHLDYDAARGLCRFSRRRLLAGAAVPFVAGARLSARITRITEKLMVVKCNDTEASVLLGDTTWTPPFRLGERYLPTRYAAGGEIEAVVERLEKSGVPRLSIRRLQPNPWLYCPVSDNDTVVAEVVGHCGEKAAVEYAGYAGLIEGLAPGLGSTLVPGDRVAVCCKAIDREQGRLRFSLVKILPRPWVEAGFRQYGTVECTVVSVGDDRTLTVDAAGYAGVVPCGELAWGEPSATFVPGQRLSAVILQIDYEDLSLALSLRYAEGIPPADMPLRIGEAHRVRITDVRTAARKMPEQLTVESVEMPALRGVIFARDLAWERAGRSAAAYRPGEEIEAVVTDLMPRKLTFKASLRDMVDDTRSLDDIRPGEKLDVTLRKFIPQEFAAEVTYYDYAGRLTLDDAVWSGVENLANFFRPGREIEAEVTAVDPDTRSLAFRLPEDEYTPDWEGVRLTEGDTLEVTADYVMDSALFVNYHGIVVTLRREELSWLPVFRIGENYRDGDTLPGESQTVRPGEPHSEIQRPGASAQPVPAGDALCGGRSGPGERHAGSSARHLRGLQRVSVLHRQYGVRRRNPPQLQGGRRASRPDSLHRPRATKNPAHPPLRRAVRRRATVQPRRMALVYRDGTDRHRPVGRIRRLSRLPVRHRCRVPGEREPQSALRTGPAGPDARDGHRRKGQCAHRIGRTGQRLFAVRQLYRRHGRCRPR